MTEHDGWLLDVYARPGGVTVWLLAGTGERRQLSHLFPVTFYAAGPSERLRCLWRYLQTHPLRPRLDRTRRTDLFVGPLDVMAIEAAGPVEQQRLFQHALVRFPDLDYYDADIPLTLHYAARYGVFPLARCQMGVDAAGGIDHISPLDSPWDLYPVDPPLRVLAMSPDTNPAHQAPSHLLVTGQPGPIQIPLEPARLLLIQLQSLLRQHDPDLLLTRWGDTWLLPHILVAAHQAKADFFNLNRDLARRPLRRKANSYFTYGQVVYRGQQVHLFGRWHIDQANAMMFGEYGLEGVLEQARVTGLPVQEIARKSPGAGITAMQILTALRRGVLVPYQKQQIEQFKTGLELIHADRGGLVYQPLIGLHHDVAEIDFTSMYPSIMARFNISPESVCIHSEQSAVVPGLEMVIDQGREGLVPATLKPLLAKRIALKQELVGLHPRDCRYRWLKARTTALKWLLVVCFGYLGYKNARFGRIEGHEAVTAYGREMLLRAKDAAEDLGYTVLHMYVDGLWVRHPDGTAANLEAVMAEIRARTGLPIALEGIYRWIAFLPSRSDPRVPVANRYFGVFQDGSFKMRGIETRRHDTPPFIAATQTRLLDYLAQAAPDQPLESRLPGLVRLIRNSLDDLHAGRVELPYLLITYRVSRLPGEFRARSPAARALDQLAAAGKELRPGQSVRFLYTCGEPGVYAWDLPAPPDARLVDVARYSDLLLRAAAHLLQPFIDEAGLRRWVAGEAHQPALLFRTQTPARVSPPLDSCRSIVFPFETTGEARLSIPTD
jgi:DNA polymerase II